MSDGPDMNILKISVTNGMSFWGGGPGRGAVSRRVKGSDTRRQVTLFEGIRD
jgi:hypothetical protein